MASTTGASPHPPPQQSWRHGRPRRVLYLVGGPPRVGKSALAQRLLTTDGVPWLPTDVLRTVLRRILPTLDAVDQGLVEAAVVGELMYPHILQAAQVCTEEYARFLIEGPEVVPAMVRRLAGALPSVDVRGCFLGHSALSPADLASYRGTKSSEHEQGSAAELDATAAWIRQQSVRFGRQCAQSALPYVDVAVPGFEAAMQQAREHLLR